MVAVVDADVPLLVLVDERRAAYGTPFFFASAGVSSFFAAIVAADAKVIKRSIFVLAFFGCSHEPWVRVKLETDFGGLCCCLGFGW